MATRSRLGMNAIDADHWLTHEPMRTELGEIHRAAVQAGLKIHVQKPVPPEVEAALNAAAYSALMDSILIARTLIQKNNDMIAMQLESLGLNISLVPTPPTD